MWETAVGPEAQKRSKIFSQDQGRFSWQNDLSAGFIEGWNSTGLSWGGVGQHKDVHPWERAWVQTGQGVFLKLGSWIQRAHGKGKFVKIIPDAAYWEGLWFHRFWCFQSWGTSTMVCFTFADIQSMPVLLHISNKTKLHSLEHFVFPP